MNGRERDLHLDSASNPSSARELLTCLPPRMCDAACCTDLAVVPASLRIAARAGSSASTCRRWSTARKVSFCARQQGLRSRPGRQRGE